MRCQTTRAILDEGEDEPRAPEYAMALSMILLTLVGGLRLNPSAIPATTGCDIIILESHAATKRREPSATVTTKPAAQTGNTIGAAVGLAPNGLSVLRDLDKKIFAEVANAGYPISHFNLASARGRSFAYVGTTNQKDPRLHPILISRQRLWNCLREHVPDHAIADHRAVAGVIYSTDQRPTIQFADGSAEIETELVIGGDGVKSVVKRFVTGDAQTDELPAYYDGLTGVGGFIPSSHLPENEPRGRMTVTFGAHGFFGYGACSIAPQSNHFAECTAPMGDEAAWWSTYETPDVPDSRRFDPRAILNQLKERHTGWADPGYEASALKHAETGLPKASEICRVRELKSYLALQKFRISDDWRHYTLCIIFGDNQERCLGLEENPMGVFKQLEKEGQRPVLKLRRKPGHNDVVTKFEENMEPMSSA
ncbi:MAG: hypothetical protein Q9210_004925 [Variospora velana]